MALLFGKVFGQTPQYWINLQATYDLKMAEKVISRRIAGIHELPSVPKPHAALDARDRAPASSIVRPSQQVDELLGVAELCGFW